MSAVVLDHAEGEVVLPLGPAPVQLADGFGGWQVIPRANDVGLTEWSGNTPIALSVPVLLDGWREGESVQPTLDELLELGRGEDREAPPHFRARGPIPFSGERFVLEAVDFGDALRSGSGELVRQALTLTLREYVRPDQIRLRRRRRRATYRVKRGDTLLRIARKLGGHRRYAREIGRLNDIRDIRRELKAGRVLRLPPRPPRDGDR